MENLYNSPDGYLGQRSRELTEKGFEVETVTLSNQGKTYTERQGENELFEKWIKEKEAAGYRREGVPLHLDSVTKVQLMVREKQE